MARDGYVWFLDRASLTKEGRFRFVEGKPYVHQNVFKSLDPVTGRPDVDPEHKPSTGKPAEFCPGSHGGKTWPPIAFSPKTRMIYIPANNNMCSSNMGVKVEYRAGKGFVGVPKPPFHRSRRRSLWRGAGVERGYGGKSVDAQLREVSQLGFHAGDGRRLVFSGGTVDRKIHAFDASTGKLLWEFPTNSGILAPPSLLFDGRKTICRGGERLGRRCARDQGTLNRLFPGEFPEVPEGGAVWVFAIE